jgi:hypothetical protein
MSPSKVAGALMAAFVSVGAILASQDALFGFRGLMSDTALPGIDTGMRDADPSRSPG